MTSVDLNCDMGEGFENDEELMRYISSANIACGFHAGDFSVMNSTVKLAVKHRVAIGVHPGFPDIKNFGRTELAVSSQAVYEMMLYQIGSLYAIVKSQGARLNHVKPHGALYNMAAVNKELSDAIVSAVFDFDPDLTLYGLANSEMIASAKRKGISFKQEVFADRTYQPNGTLTPRSQPGALIENIKASIDQVLQMVKENKVTATNNTLVSIQPDTICLHGDGLHAVEFAQGLHAKLKEEGIQITSSR